MPRRLLLPFQTTGPPRATRDTLDAGIALWIVKALTRVTGSYATMQGLFIVLGGEQRWRASALRVAMTLPGAPASWGWTLAVAGLVVMLGTLSRRWRMAAPLGLVTIAAWCFFFAASQAMSAIKTPTASVTGIGTYACLTIFAAMLGAAYAESHR